MEACYFRAPAPLYYPGHAAEGLGPYRVGEVLLIMSDHADHALDIAGTFEPRVFLSGVVTNMALAGGLTYVGDKLGVDLSIAAIVAFGVRIFNNLASIRRHYL